VARSTSKLVAVRRLAACRSKARLTLFGQETDLRTGPQFDARTSPPPEATV